MKVIFKSLAWLVAVLVVIVVALVIIVPLVVDPNDYKDEIARVVQEKTGRTLSIEGDLELSVFPMLGIETGRVTFSNPDGFDGAPMLEVSEARARLRLLPLLSRKVEAGAIEIRGLAVNLITSEGGVTNWEDLAKRSADGGNGQPAAATDSGALAALAIQGLVVDDGSLTWDDRSTGNHYEIKNLTVKTGVIRPGEPIPINLTMDVEGDALPEPISITTDTKVTLIPQRNLVELDQLALTVKGATLDIALHAAQTEYRLDAQSANAIDVVLSGGLTGTAVELRVPGLDIDVAARRVTGSNVTATATQGDMSVAITAPTLSFDGEAGTVVIAPLSANVEMPGLSGTIQAPEVRGDLDTNRFDLDGLRVTAQQGKLQAELTAPAVRLEMATQQFAVPEFTLLIANSTVNGSLQADRILEAPQFSGRLNAKQIDLRQILDALEVGFTPQDDTALRALQLDTAIEATTKSVTLSDLNGTIDSTSFDGEITIQNFQHPAYRLRLDVGELTLDRYLPAAPGGAASAAAPAAAAAPFALPALNIDAELRMQRLNWQQGGYVVEDMHVKSTLTDTKASAPVSVRARASGASLPEPLDLAIDTQVGTQSDKGIELTEFSATATGATTSAKIVVPTATIGAGDQPIVLNAVTVTVEQPDANIELQIPSLRFDPNSQALEVKGATGRGQFQAVAAALNVPALSANFGANTYAAPSIVLVIEHDGPPTRITIPDLDVDLSKQTAKAGALQLDGPDGRVDAEVSATSIIDAPTITAKLAAKDFNLRSLLQRISVPLDTADPMALQRVSIDTQISTGPDKIDISALTATIDDTQIDGTLTVSGLPDARYHFDLKIGELDMDRYLPSVPTGESATSADEANAAAAVVLPLAMLRNLSIDGKLRAEQLKSKGLRVSNLAISVQSRNGKIALKPIEAELYEGRSQGEIAVDATTDTPRLNVRNSLSTIQIGPALHDAGISDKLSGTGNLNVDIAASGVDDLSLKKTMNGDVGFDLKNGAIKGFDIQKIVLRARQAYERSKKREVTADPDVDDETRFSEMSGTLAITDGIVRNDDLNIKAPVFRISGTGQASLIQNQIDYLFDVTLVESVEGQGGADLGDLEGVAIPVRVKGPLDAPRYFVDLNHLLKARVDEEIEKEKDKAKKKLEKKLRKKLKDLFD